MSEVVVRMGKLPERCVDCAIRMRCVTYLMALYKTENVYELESLKPEIGSKDCAIVCVLPEQHGNLIDGDLAKARIHKNIIDYYENGSGGYYLAEDAEEEVGLMVKYEAIVPATERSE